MFRCKKLQLRLPYSGNIHPKLKGGKLTHLCSNKEYLIYLNFLSCNIQISSRFCAAKNIRHIFSYSFWWNIQISSQISFPVIQKSSYRLILYPDHISRINPGYPITNSRYLEIYCAADIFRYWAGPPVQMSSDWKEPTQESLTSSGFH